jgi:hypothetical protein
MVFYLAYRYCHIVGRTCNFSDEAGLGCSSLHCNGIYILPCLSNTRRKNSRFQPTGFNGKGGFNHFFKEFYIGNDSGFTHVNRAVSQIVDGVEETEDAKADLWNFGDAVEAQRTTLARESRTPGKLKVNKINVYGNQAAVIFLRSWERSQTIYSSMLSRGFKGEFPDMHQLNLRVSDVLFATMFIFIFLLIRIWN